LRRSRSDRKIAGVCGGLAEWGGWDPTVVRLVFVLGLLLPGPGVIFYLILWLVVPEGDEVRQA
jgi:phage shock protein PspC (stress-responsive transcriptional regulator)